MGGYTVKSYFNPIAHRGARIACLVCSDSYSSVDPKNIIDKWRPHFVVVAFANSTENHKSLIHAGRESHEQTDRGANDDWIILSSLELIASKDGGDFRPRASESGSRP